MAQPEKWTLRQKIIGVLLRQARLEVGKTLKEQLAEAISAEQYELAARLRDKLNNRDTM